jgi:O-antigen/teichoic acid export membrane protein
MIRCPKAHDGGHGVAAIVAVADASAGGQRVNGCGHARPGRRVNGMMRHRLSSGFGSSSGRTAARGDDAGPAGEVGHARTKSPLVERLAGWIGVAAVDAVGRLLLQVVTTMVLARWLAPEDFGTAALVLTVTAVAAVTAGPPFEEPIAQRRVIRRGHLQTALAVSWTVAALVFALSLGVGPMLAAAFDAPALALLLPFAMLVPAANGPFDIAKAWARRRRRFNDIAVAHLAGHAVGATAAITLATVGAGVWSIVAFRLVTLAAAALILVARLGLWLVPRWSARRLRELRWFAGVSLTARLIDDLVYLVFNYAVGVLFGLATLGYFNMALRVVEPIRGAVIAIAHNLSFAWFVHSAGKRDRLGSELVTATAYTGFSVAPAFFGIAAVAPVLITVMAGEGWRAAAVITVWLALGSGLLLPVQLVITALNASGRPQHAVWSGIWGSIAMAVVLVATLPAQALAPALARCAGDVARTVYALAVAQRRLAVPWPRLLAPLAAAWSVAGTMALAVATLSRLLPADLSGALVLPALVLFGMAFYAFALWLLFGDRVHRVRRRLLWS